MRRRHLVYLVALAERLAERISLPEAERVLARLDAEHDDVRAALAWAEASGEAALGLRLARAMINYWIVRGHLREGRGWLERALGWGSPTPSAERARALSGLGWLARFQGDSDRAEAAFGEALRIAVAVGARMTTARALTGLALVHLDRGRYEEAAARLDEALARYQELEPVLVAGPMYVSATLRAPGADRPRRRRPRRRGPLPGGGGAAAAGAGLRLGAERDPALPGRPGARPRRSRRRAGPLPGEPRRWPRRAATRSWWPTRSTGWPAWRRPGASAERAARLYGAAAALRERLGAAVVPWERPAHERDLAAVRAALGPAAFAAAWAAGAALPLEAAVAEALADASRRPRRQPATAAGRAGSGGGLGLTPRESWRCCACWRRGCSNREIGEALFISPRTVNFHVTNLLAKLEPRLPRRRRRLRRPPRAGLSPA